MVDKGASVEMSFSSTRYNCCLDAWNFGREAESSSFSSMNAIANEYAQTEFHHFSYKDTACCSVANSLKSILLSIDYKEEIDE